LFAPEPDPVHVALRALEPAKMTPLEALVALDRLKSLAGERS
jgi:hypothetical protein